MIKGSNSIEYFSPLHLGAHATPAAGCNGDVDVAGMILGFGAQSTCLLAVTPIYHTWRVIQHTPRQDQGR